MHDLRVLIHNQAMFTSAIQTLQANHLQFNQSAARIARLSEDLSVDLVSEQLEQLKLKESSSAQLKVLRAQDEMLGWIIDLKA